jgi:DNA-binding transcriptional ArsR family regulator
VFVTTYPLDAWALLGDGSRRAIIERLSDGPCTVSELAGAMPISRPAVSQHLKVLRDAGVVRDDQHGRNRVYSLDAHRLARYRQELDRFWADALCNLTTSNDDQQEEIG